MEQFILNVVENLVAQFPQLVMVVTTVYYGIKSVKKVSSSMPDLLQLTKKELHTAYKDSSEKVLKVFNDATKQLKEEVNQSLVTMASELNDYKKQLIQNAEQTNLVVRESKVFMDIISELLKQDPELIRSGIRKSIQTKISLTKEELENFPKLLLEDANILFKALQESALVMGEKNLEEMLGKLGYERKKL